MRSSRLLTERFPSQKVLVFSQFADTVRYLDEQLTARGVEALAAVTGDSNGSHRPRPPVQPQ